MPFSPLATKLKPTVAPTMLCVAETGRLRKVAMTSQMQEPRVRAVKMYTNLLVTSIMLQRLHRINIS